MEKRYDISVETKNCYDKKQEFSGPILLIDDKMIEGIVFDESTKEKCFVFGEVNGNLVDLVISHRFDEKVPTILCLERNKEDFYDGMNFGINSSNYSIEGYGNVYFADPNDWHEISTDDRDCLGESIEYFKKYDFGPRSNDYYDKMRTVVGGHK